MKNYKDMESFSRDLTRKEQPSEEGKALGNPSVKCGLCHVDISTKHCHDCNQPLCDRCVTSHGNIPFTKNHRLIDITEFKSTKTVTAKPKCSKHHKKPLRAICEECLQSMCDDCVVDHKGHKVQYAEFQVSFLQNVSAQKVPGLMQITQKLEKLKDGSIQKISLYKEAKRLVTEWREHLIKIINDESDQLLIDIQKEITKQEILSSKTKDDVNDFISNADDIMTILGNARKITDTSVLLNNIHECDQIIEKMEGLVIKLEAMTTSYTTDDLFVHKNQQHHIEKGLHDFFTITPLPESNIIPSVSKLPDNLIPHKVPDAASTSKYSVARLGNKPCGSTSKTKITSGLMATRKTPVFDRVKCIADKYIGYPTYFGFCISENNDDDTNTVMIYACTESAVHVFDIDADILIRYDYDKKIARMCTLSSGKHVIRESATGDVHIVDKDFQTLATMKRRHDWDTYKPRAVCHKSDDTFLMTEDKDDSKTRLSEVTVLSDNTFKVKSLHEMDVFNSRALLLIHPSMEYVTMLTGTTTSCKSLCKVNLKTGQDTHIDLSKQLQSTHILSIHTNFDGTTIVGDTSGYVHKVINMQYEGQVSGLKQDERVTAITTRGDKVIIVSGDKLYVYQ